jgi:outer membrane immunogenic protein
MKKTPALTLTILCAFGAFAYAGPEPYSGKEMKEIAPMPPPCPNWTGFYVGGFGGYKFGSPDVNLDLFGFWDGQNPLRDPVDRDFLEPLFSDVLNTSGFDAGGLIGYNRQFNKWVVGIEASAAYVWLDDADNTGSFSVPGSISTFQNVHTSFDTNYLLTVGPRIGYAYCKWLPYVTGGLAVGDIDFEQRIIESDIGFQEGGSVSDTRLGWMVGGGLQYAITDHWSARAQYQFIDLGSVDFDSVGGPAAFDAGYVGNHEVRLREHNASFAIIYGF